MVVELFGENMVKQNWCANKRKRTEYGFFVRRCNVHVETGTVKHHKSVSC